MKKILWCLKKMFVKNEVIDLFPDKKNVLNDAEGGGGGGGCFCVSHFLDR